jgi:hypothetical protein
MLHRIVNLIKSSTYKIESTTLFCRDYIIQDVECLNYLETNNVLESPLHTTSLNSTIDLELSLAYLNSLGFYETDKSFILKNKYIEPTIEYYLLDLDAYKGNSCVFFDKYKSILNLIMKFTEEKLDRHFTKLLAKKAFCSFLAYTDESKN